MNYDAERLEIYTSGAWSDISNYVSQNSTLSWSRGAMGNSVADRVARPGQISFTLHDTSGQFDPINSAAVLTSGTPIRFVLDYEGITRVVWYGKIRNVSPREDDLFKTWAQVVGVCVMDEFNRPLVTPGITTNKTASEVVDEIIDDLGLTITAAQKEYGTMSQTFPSVFDTVRTKQNALGEISKAVMSEMGYIGAKGTRTEADNYILTIDGRDTREERTFISIPVGSDFSGFLLKEDGGAAPAGTPQTLRPDSTIDNTDAFLPYNAGSLHNALGDNASFIYQNDSGTHTCIVGLQNGTDDLTGVVKIEWNSVRTAASEKACWQTMALYEGTTLIATSPETQITSSAYTWYEYILTAGEVAAITDRTALRGVITHRIASGDAAISLRLAQFKITSDGGTVGEATGEVVFLADFEDGTTNYFDGSRGDIFGKTNGLYDISVVASPALGDHAVGITLPVGDDDEEGLAGYLFTYTTTTNPVSHHYAHIYFPSTMRHPYIDAWWYNFWQHKSVNNTYNKPVIMLGMAIYDGVEQITMANWTNGQGANPAIGRTQTTPIAFPRDQWVEIHTEFYSVNDFTGYCICYQDGVEILRIEGIQTRPNNQAVLWSVNSYTNPVTEEFTIYVDNMKIQEDGGGSGTPSTGTGDGFLLKEDGGKITLDQAETFTTFGTFTEFGVISDKQLAYGKNIVNDCIVTVYPRTYSASTEILYNLATIPGIDVGETREITARYRDPDNEAVNITARTMLAPVATTDYTANAAADGSGTNLTTDLTVTAVYSAAEIKYTLANTGATKLYVTKLQARGEGIFFYSPVTLQAEDVASQAANGYRVLSLAPRYLDDVDDGQDIADAIVASAKNIFPDVDWIEIDANANSRNLFACMFLDLGDPINITLLNADSIMAARKFYINGINWSGVRGNWKVRYTIASQEVTEI